MQIHGLGSKKQARIGPREAIVLDFMPNSGEEFGETELPEAGTSTVNLRRHRGFSP